MFTSPTYRTLLIIPLLSSMFVGALLIYALSKPQKTEKDLIINFTPTITESAFQEGKSFYSAEISEPSFYKNVPVSINGRMFKLELVDTPPLRTEGLSGRSELCITCGMMFVFDTTARHGIWMKEMNFAIDIIWLDETRKIIHVERAVSPDTYPTVFYPPTPARYVIELPAGTVPKSQTKRIRTFR